MSAPPVQAVEFKAPLDALREASAALSEGFRTIEMGDEFATRFAAALKAAVALHEAGEALLEHTVIKELRTDTNAIANFRAALDALNHPEV